MNERDKLETYTRNAMKNSKVYVPDSLSSMEKNKRLYKELSRIYNQRTDHVDGVIFDEAIFFYQEDKELGSEPVKDINKRLKRMERKREHTDKHKSEAEET